MPSRMPNPADPFEEGLGSGEPGLTSNRITGDPQDDLIVPGDAPGAVDDFGTTAAEEQQSEPLGLRLSREEFDLGARADQSPTADQPYPEDREEWVGRIVETDEGARGDDEPDAVAHDVGTDRGAFTAEERTMHVEPEA